MKICWNNLEKLRYSQKTGKWYNKYKTSFTIKICPVCNEDFLGAAKNKYCSQECTKKSKEYREKIRNKLNGHSVSKETREKISKINKGRKHTEETKRKVGEKSKGRKHTEETKKKLSNINKGKEFSEEHRENISKGRKGKLKGNKNPNWNGGYRKKNIASYSAFAHQIDWVDECRRNKEDPNILEVKCAYCGKWFVPSWSSVSNRAQHLKGNDKYTELRLYCSDSCKKECPIYHKSYITLMKEDAVRVGRLNWIELNREVQPELRQMVLKRDNYTCQKCGNTEHLHCHHIIPASIDPIESADMDNCITYCKWCHVQVHKLPGCKHNELRNCNG